MRAPMINRLVDNLPPSGLGDALVDQTVKIAYKDGAKQAFLTVLDILEAEYMKPEVKMGSDEATSILKISNLLVKEIRERHSALDRL
jgi:hypothetical protein